MFFCYYHRGTTYIISSESESEDDLIEQAYVRMTTKLMGSTPKDVR